MKFTLALIVSLVLMTGVSVLPQPYELNWKDLNVPVREDAGKHHQGLPQATRLSFPERRQKVAPVTVAVTAKESYDYYKSRYRKVKRVESIVYRGGYPQETTYCNQAKYDSYDIYLKNLKVGDRYQVRVTWDDGSHRTLDRTIGTDPATSVLIDQPLAFDNPFDS